MVGRDWLNLAFAALHHPDSPAADFPYSGRERWRDLRARALAVQARADEVFAPMIEWVLRAGARPWRSGLGRMGFATYETG